MSEDKSEPNAIRDYWKAHHTFKGGFSGALPDRFTTCPGVVCADGFKMSVQASGFHYCSPPRTYKADGEYWAWEVGFPSEREELLMPHAESPEQPTETVYGYVPTGTVNAVIAKHGGLAHRNKDRTDV